MGLELSLLPELNKDSGFSHNIISLHRDIELFDSILKIENIKGIPCSDLGFYSHMSYDEKKGDYCYGITKESPYGGIIKSLYSHELKSAIDVINIKDWQNKAVFDYIKNFPSDIKIYLFWH